MAKKQMLLMLAAMGLAVLAAGCATGPARSPMAGPDWSRGILVGECSFNDTVAVYPDDGGLTHLAWGRVAPSGDRIRYVRLDAQATVLQERDLPLAVQSPRQVRLLPDGQGGLILCWMNGVSDGRRLLAAHLDPAGEVLAGPTPASGLEVEVNEYVAVPAAGGADVFWSHKGGPSGGLYYLRLDRTARPAAPSRLLVPGAIGPDAQAAGDGRVHLTWIYEPGYSEENVYYAAFDPARQEMGAPVQVGHFSLSPKASRYGPVLALSKDWVHIAWSWEHLASGSQSAAGEAQCRYVSFPIGNPTGAQERPLAVPSNPRPAYAATQGAFAYSRLAGLEGQGSDLVYMPNAAPGQRDEAALGVAFETSTRNRSRVQIGVVYINQAAAKGYQVAGASDILAMRPVLAADRQNQVHAAWLEPAGFNRYRVYYASMDPAARAALGRLGLDDVVAAAYAAAWALVQSMSLFPLGFVWLFPPFVWVMLFHLFKPDGELFRRGPQVALAIAILLYTFDKFFVLPANFVGAAPFLDRLSPAVADVFVVALPAAILLAALGALGLYVRRREAPTLLMAYLVFGATDTLLTFLLYARGILG